MKKERTQQRKAQAAPAVNQPVRICFERIVPDVLDPERMVRRSMRDQMIQVESRDGKRKLKAPELQHIARMAVQDSKRWEPGSTIRCRFLDGSAKMRKKVRKVAAEWQQYADIKIRFVTSGDAEVRISFFADAGSWSAVGRDCLNTAYFPVTQPTMNFGWLRDATDDTEYHRVVTHEFGHALGCTHEHESPKFTRKWNVPAVMKYFQGPPNYWSAADIKSNVLHKYSAKGISATQYDPNSIMLYAFDAALFSDGLGATNENTNVSTMDKQMIKKMYP